MSDCGCGCGGHGGCGARAYEPRRRRPYYTGRLRRRGYEPEYMAAPAPAFGARMSFAAALANPAANSTGLYRIYKNGRPVYAGRAAPGTIRSRLINHRWCLTHMGVEDSAYTVSFAPMSGSTTAQVVSAEKREIRRMRTNRVHRGTNVREGEFEAMLSAASREWEAMASGPPRRRPRPTRPGRGPKRSQSATATTATATATSGTSKPKGTPTRALQLIDQALGIMLDATPESPGPMASARGVVENARAETASLLQDPSRAKIRALKAADGALSMALRSWSEGPRAVEPRLMNAKSLLMQSLN